MEDTTKNERKSYQKYFTLNQMENVTLKDDSPEELRYFIMKVHNTFDVLPNDWIYLQIANAFEELESDDIDDITIEPDSYYNDLYKWLGESFAQGCIEEYMNDIGNSTKDIYALIACGQWLAKDRIYRMVSEFIGDGE